MNKSKDISILPVNSYQDLREAIRKKIRNARYLAASAVNREILCLYYAIGELISASVNQKGWGKKAITTLSNDIQADFPGIRGFSERNLINMRRYYEHYFPTEFGQLLTAQMKDTPITQLPTAQLAIKDKSFDRDYSLPGKEKNNR